MSTATEEPKPEPAVKAGPMVTYPEQYNCPRCEGLIAKECVAGNLADGGRRRHVRVYCTHCKAGFEAVFALRDGRLIQETQPTVLHGPRLESFKNRIDQIRGDLRLPASTGN